ncbi:MAG TPA: flagellar biosynthetic protein FliR [Planctomycetota bacterium]|jgi:flagellar biosynthetic protein FliR
MNPFGIENVPFFALLAIRLGGLMMAAPVFGSPQVPLALRGALALVLAFMFMPFAGPAPAGPTGAVAFALAAASELSVGLLIGFTASLLFASVRLAGHLVDQDLGLSLASILDPMADESISVVGQFQTLLAVVVYLLINGHHVLMTSVADSFRAVPVGGFAFSAAATPSVVGDMAARLFVVALGLAIPALATLFLVTVAMAFLARAVPEMNLLTLGYPIRTLVGFAVLAAGVGIFVRGFARFAADQEGLLRGLVVLLGGRP